jgi:hypothetical protein
MFTGVINTGVDGLLGILNCFGFGGGGGFVIFFLYYPNWWFRLVYTGCAEVFFCPLDMFWPILTFILLFVVKDPLIALLFTLEIPLDWFGGRFWTFKLLKAAGSIWLVCIFNGLFTDITTV